MCFLTKYSATLKADVTCRGYVGILLSAQVSPVNQGGTADKFLFVLDRSIFCQGRFLFLINSFG